MISIDTNIFLYSQNTDCKENSAAFGFISEYGQRDDIIICELVLVELYMLLRNPAVVKKPLSSLAAVNICQIYRQNPRWRLIENADIMENVWTIAKQENFARRQIIDARLALTLKSHGVTEIATANTKDFENFGFNRVWNPL